MGEVVDQTLSHIWKTLEPLGIPIALMGGMSLAAWKHIRATQDVDILIGIDRTEVQRAIDWLSAHGLKPKKHPPLVVVGDHSFVQFLYTPPGEFFEIQFDLLLAETDLQKSALARRVFRELPGISQPLSVLCWEDLVLFKLIAGRMIDRADAAMLLRENRSAIDLPYLMEWVNKLQLDREYTEIWNEAFPEG